MDLKQHIRDVPDFPKPGILFYDISTLLAHAAALRRMHDEPTRTWTVGERAVEAALSRSTFFNRFCREVGEAPMEYLLGWRMAIAKDLLRGRDVSVGEVAQRVGYSSSSTFSVAFTRQVCAADHLRPQTCGRAGERGFRRVRPWSDPGPLGGRVVRCR